MMTTEYQPKNWTAAQLQGFAADHAGAIYGPGEAGHCPASRASWTLEATFDLSAFLHLMEQAEAGWKKWFADELQMDADEQLHRGWADLLVEPIREEVIVLVRGEKAYLWDGWHRVAASIVAGRKTIPAIVGRPL